MGKNYQPQLLSRISEQTVSMDSSYWYDQGWPWKDCNWWKNMCTKDVLVCTGRSVYVVYVVPLLSRFASTEVFNCIQLFVFSFWETTVCPKRCMNWCMVVLELGASSWCTAQLFLNWFLHCFCFCLPWMHPVKKLHVWVVYFVFWDIHILYFI